jgi:hypothetical protein
MTGHSLQAGNGHEVSIIGLLGLTLQVPDHTTLSRRSATLDVPRPQPTGAGGDTQPVHLLVGVKKRWSA